MKFRVSGAAALAAALKSYENRSASHFQKGLKQAAKLIVDTARPLAPIDTGALRASGVWFAQGSGFATVAFAGFGAEVDGFYDDRGREKIPSEYAVYQHEDTFQGGGHFYLERAVDEKYYEVSSLIYTAMAKA